MGIIITYLIIIIIIIIIIVCKHKGVKKETLHIKAVVNTLKTKVSQQHQIQAGVASWPRPCFHTRMTFTIASSHHCCCCCCCG